MPISTTARTYLVREKHQQGVSGNNLVTMPVNDLPAGIYLSNSFMETAFVTLRFNDCNTWGYFKKRKPVTAMLQVFTTQNQVRNGSKTLHLPRLPFYQHMLVSSEVYKD